MTCVARGEAFNVIFRWNVLLFGLRVTLNTDYNFSYKQSKFYEAKCLFVGFAILFNVLEKRTLVFYS
jgi:hypothetical protein